MVHMNTVSHSTEHTYGAYEHSLTQHRAYLWCICTVSHSTEHTSNSAISDVTAQSGDKLFTGQIGNIAGVHKPQAPGRRGVQIYYGSAYHL